MNNPTPLLRVLHHMLVAECTHSQASSDPLAVSSEQQQQTPKSDRKRKKQQGGAAAVQIELPSEARALCSLYGCLQKQTSSASILAPMLFHFPDSTHPDSDDCSDQTASDVSSLQKAAHRVIKRCAAVSAQFMSQEHKGSGEAVPRFAQAVLQLQVGCDFVV